MTSLALAKIFSVKDWNFGQSAFEKFMKVDGRELNFLSSAVILIMIGRWSELSLFSTCHLEVAKRLAEAMDMSGDVDEVLVTLVGRSSFRKPQSCPVTMSARALPLASGVEPVNHSSLWAFRSPQTK